MLGWFKLSFSFYLFSLPPSPPSLFPSLLPSIPPSLPPSLLPSFITSSLSPSLPLVPPVGISFNIYPQARSVGSTPPHHSVKVKYGICMYMYLYIHIYRSGNLWSNFLGDVHVNVDTLYMYSTCKLNFLLTGFSYRWSNRTPLELKVHVIKYIA